MMSVRLGLCFGAGLIGFGLVIAAPEFLLIGLLALLVVGITQLWGRYGLCRLHYERRLDRERTVWGDDVGLEISVRNNKVLPLVWLAVDDFVSDSMAIREEKLQLTDERGIGVLRSRWTVGWFERVSRRLTIAADRRGVYTFERVRVTVADIFGYGTASEEHEDKATLIVRPRTLPVRISALEHAPAGDLRTRRSLYEDPALFAGVRPYHPGDPLRRVHWRATARTGVPVSKRFDPSRDQDILLALDLQTMSGRIWTKDDDLVEAMMVAASSLARHSLIEGASCGLAAMAYDGAIKGFALMAPRSGRDQIGSIADMLGRLDTAPSAPFENLLVRLPQRVSPGTTIIVLTARDPEQYVGALIRLHRSGYPVQLVGFGPNGHLAAGRARSYGMTAMTGSLTPDWRTSDALVLAS
jgi:uncharacterized protein (DUF58 family)